MVLMMFGRALLKIPVAGLFAVIVIVIVTAAGVVNTDRGG